MKTTFIITAYGERFLGMLISCLESIAMHAPDANIVVAWQDMPAEAIPELEKAYPKLKTIQTDFDFKADQAVRIASKTLLWEAAAMFAAESDPDVEQLIYLDVDTLLLQDPRPALEKIEGNVLFTTKDKERYPINTGVLVVRNKAIPQLLTLWREDTMEVLKDKVLFAQSQSADYPYGAPDQLSFYRLVGYEIGKTGYTIEASDSQMLSATAIDCTQFNQTNSVPISDDIFIAHYKSSWQKIILDGEPFNKKRPREDSWELFQYYLQTHLRSLKRIQPGAQSLFAITIPAYVKDIEGTFSFDEAAYQTLLAEWKKSEPMRKFQSLCSRVVKKLRKVLGR